MKKKFIALYVAAMFCSSLFSSTLEAQVINPAAIPSQAIVGSNPDDDGSRNLYGVRIPAREPHDWAFERFISSDHLWRTLNSMDAQEMVDAVISLEEGERALHRRNKAIGSSDMAIYAVKCFSKPFKIGSFGWIFSVFLKFGKPGVYRPKLFCPQKTSYFNKTA